MRGRNRAGATAVGYCIFLLTVGVIVGTSTLIFHAAVQKFGYNAWLLSAVMLVTIVFFSVVCILIDVLRRRITVERPLKEILDATRKIASGDFSVRLTTRHPYRRYDAYDCIMDNLNTMAAELTKTQMLRNDFISNVSHELKTPLAVIQNYATALQNVGLDAETRAQYAKVLVDTSRKLTDLIVNILKLNKLENQEIKADMQIVRLDEMLAQAVLRFEAAIEEKQLKISCDMDEIEVYSAPGYLEIVWNNLVSNAVKFTEAGGEIKISVKTQAGRPVVRVADTGCGISKETGEHIFDKFFQGDTSHAQAGNGLGLALVKQVIDSLGGEISVESQAGEGSVFTVVLSEAAR